MCYLYKTFLHSLELYSKLGENICCYIGNEHCWTFSFSKTQRNKCPWQNVSPLQHKAALCHLICILGKNYFWAVAFKSIHTFTAKVWSQRQELTGSTWKQQNTASDLHCCKDLYFCASQHLHFHFFQSKITVNHLQDECFTFFKRIKWSTELLVSHSRMQHRCSLQGKLVFHREMYLYRLCEYLWISIAHAHNTTQHTQHTCWVRLYLLLMLYSQWHWIIQDESPREYCPAGQSKQGLDVRCFYVPCLCVFRVVRVCLWGGSLLSCVSFLTFRHLYCKIYHIENTIL